MTITQFLFTFILSGTLFFANGQEFINPDLNGTAGSSVNPDNWEKVPFTDPDCQAANNSTDTPDLLDINGPDVASGIYGTAYSGTTFLSGLLSKNFANPPGTFHEGIMQSVSGFTPGDLYSINFHQAIIKQSNALRDSGSWAVYVNDVLVGVSEASISTAPFDTAFFNWEKRTIRFTAPATTLPLEFKFLPHDDGGDYFFPNKLRIGIDSISLQHCSFSVNLGNDRLVCEDENLVLDARSQQPYETYLWQDGSTGPEFPIDTAGTYWVEVTSNSCVRRDTINLTIDDFPDFELGNDTVLCPGETLLLDATIPRTAFYIWQDNTIDSLYTVTEAGTYSVQVISNGCLMSDSITVSVGASTPINLGPDSTICEGDTILINPTFVDASYTWQDGSTQPFFVVTEPGEYSLIVSDICGTADGTRTIEQGVCEIDFELPIVFSPNGDGINDHFAPLTVSGVQSGQLSIYNRWGHKIFSSDDISTLGWEGRNNSGQPVTEGTYFWVLEYTGLDQQKYTSYGTITLTL